MIFAKVTLSQHLSRTRDWNVRRDKSFRKTVISLVKFLVKSQRNLKTFSSTFELRKRTINKTQNRANHPPTNVKVNWRCQHTREKNPQKLWQHLPNVCTFTTICVCQGSFLGWKICNAKEGKFYSFTLLV